MNEFWMWFWRPIAEALGAVALLVAVFGIAYAAAYLYGWHEARTAKRRAREQQQRDEVRQKARSAL